VQRPTFCGRARQWWTKSLAFLPRHYAAIAAIARLVTCATPCKGRQITARTAATRATILTDHLGNTRQVPAMAAKARDCGDQRQIKTRETAIGSAKQQTRRTWKMFRAERGLRTPFYQRRIGMTLGTFLRCVSSPSGRTGPCFCGLRTLRTDLGSCSAKLGGSYYGVGGGGNKGSPKPVFPGLFVEFCLRQALAVGGAFLVFFPVLTPVRWRPVGAGGRRSRLRRRRGAGRSA